MIQMGRDAFIWPPESYLIHTPTVPVVYNITPLQPEIADQATEEARARFKIKRDDLTARHAAKALRVCKLPSISLAPKWAIKRKNEARAAVSVHENEVVKGVEWSKSEMGWDGEKGEKARLGRWIQVEGE